MNKNLELSKKDEQALVISANKTLALVKKTDTDKSLDFYNKLDEKEGMNHANFLGV